VFRQLIACTLGFALAATKARADLVTYTLTGTVRDVTAWTLTSPVNPGVAPVAVGDRLSWTLQYDRAAPVVQSSSYMTTSTNLYSPAGPLLSNLVDQTRNLTLYTAPAGSIPANNFTWQSSKLPFSSLQVENTPSSGVFSFTDSSNNGLKSYFAGFHLVVHQPLATMNLAKIQLDQLPFDFNQNNAFLFSYSSTLQNGKVFYDFDALANSLSPSASIASLPEPGTLSLFALGAIGLALHRFRRAPEAV
jgi:hypothetical protein